MSRPGARGAHRKDDEFEEGEEELAPPVRKRTYPCSILGGIVGLAIGALVVVSMTKKANVLPGQEAKLKQDYIASVRADMIAERKRDFKQTIEARRVQVRKLLDGVRKLDSPAERKESLLQALGKVCDGPGGPELAEALVEVWPKALAGETSGGKADESGFAAHRDEANKLYAGGKIGEAIDRIRRAEGDFQGSHGKEIDELVMRWSEEITTRWDADLKRANRLARDGDADGAQKVLREAMSYGDGPVRREAEKTLDSIQVQALMATRAAKKSSQKGAGADSEKEDDASDLEEEFKEEENVEAPVKPEGDKAEGEGGGAEAKGE